MKKSKLTGTLAVGGGLKHAVVPYIITGEEDNGYSKGDILDANYVKQLINNNTIPDDIQANTLTLNGPQIIIPNEYWLSIQYNNGTELMTVSPYCHKIFSDNVTIQGGMSYNRYANLIADLKFASMNFVNGNQVLINGTKTDFPTGTIKYDNNIFAFIRNGYGIYLDSSNVTIAAYSLRMGNNTSALIQYYYNNGSWQYKKGDVAFHWKDGILFLNKIYKTTQDTSEKDLFERVSDLETPKTTRENNPKVGQCVFDTALGKPIWCKTAKTGTTAAVWVDATGATV